jgi:hypothetical protein
MGKDPNDLDADERYIKLDVDKFSDKIIKGSEFNVLMTEKF